MSHTRKMDRETRLAISRAAARKARANKLRMQRMWCEGRRDYDAREEKRRQELARFADAIMQINLKGLFT